MSVHQLSRRVGDIHLITVVEVVFTVLAVYLFGGGTLVPVDPTRVSVPEQVIETGNPIDYVVLSLVYLAALALMARRARAMWRAATSDFLLLALLGLTLASALWSDAPDVTFRRAVGLIGTSLFGVYLSVRYDTREQLRFLAAGLGMVLLVNVLVAVVHPTLLVAEGGFKGIHEHKNVLGKIMSLITLVFVCLTFDRKTRLIGILGAGLAMLLVVSSLSATAFLVFLTLIALVPLLRLLRRELRLVVVLGILGILLAGVGVLAALPRLQSMTAVVGRDLTLTGRTILWPYVIDIILQRPVLGYGYQAFWLQENTLRGAIDAATGWRPAHSHNGFLEVSLALGGVGLVLFVAGLLRAFARALTWARRDSTPAGLWPVLFLCFLVLYNVTEETALTRNSLFWVLYVSVVVGLAPSTVRAHARRSRPLPPPAVAPSPGPTSAMLQAYRSAGRGGR